MITRNTRAAAPQLLDGNRIKGYAIVFGSLNDYNEIAEPGCCLKSLRLRGIGGKAGNNIQLLAYHDSEKIMGRLTRLEEDGTGLYFEAELLDLDGTRDEVKRIREGLLRQLSYGFAYKEGGYFIDEDGRVHLTDIDLFEISLVTFSSDPKAQLRAACATMTDEDAAAALEALKKRGQNDLKPADAPATAGDGVVKRLGRILNL